MQQRDDQPCRYSPRCTVHPPIGAERQPSRITRQIAAEVHELIAEGRPTRWVARQLGISQSAVAGIWAGTYQLRRDERVESGS